MNQKATQGWKKNTILKMLGADRGILRTWGPSNYLFGRWRVLETFHFPGFNCVHLWGVGMGGGEDWEGGGFMGKPGVHGDEGKQPLPLPQEHLASLSVIPVFKEKCPAAWPLNASQALNLVLS